MLKMTKKSKGSINEADIVVRALRLNTLSKLTFGDSIRFDTLVKDVFPNVTFSNEGYEELKVELRKSFTALGYIINENQVKKAIELYEQLQVNLCQKLLFLHQLTHNMTTDCSLFMKIVSPEYLLTMLCTEIVVVVFFCFF